MMLGGRLEAIAGLVSLHCQVVTLTLKFQVFGCTDKSLQVLYSVVGVVGSLILGVAYIAVSFCFLFLPAPKSQPSNYANTTQFNTDLASCRHYVLYVMT